MLLSQISVPNGWVMLDNSDTTGGASGEWLPGSRTATLNFLVYWSDLESFLQQCAGYPVIYGVGGGASITQQIPLIYPFNSKLYAQRITHRSVTTNNQLTAINNANPYTKALVTVEFGSFPYQLGTGSTPWLEIDCEGSADFITLPGVAFQFSNGEKVEQDVGRIVGQKAFRVTRYQIPDFDQWLAVSDPAMGCVNSDTVTISKTSYAPGYLLFPTQSIRSETNVLGSPMTQASITLVHRSVPWNQAMRSDGTFDTLSPAPYPTGPLSPLLN